MGHAALPRSNTILLNLARPKKTKNARRVGGGGGAFAALCVTGTVRAGGACAIGMGAVGLRDDSRRSCPRSSSSRCHAGLFRPCPPQRRRPHNRGVHEHRLPNWLDLTGWVERGCTGLPLMPRRDEIGPWCTPSHRFVAVHRSDHTPAGLPYHRTGKWSLPKIRLNHRPGRAFSIVRYYKVFDLEIVCYGDRGGTLP